MVSKVYFVKTTPDAIIPKRNNSTDAGMDLHAAEDVTVPPNAGRRMVSTGLKIGIFPDFVKDVLEIEDGSFQSFKIDETLNGIISNVEQLQDCIESNNVVSYIWQAEVRPRSGLAWKKGVTVMNTPGTVDNGYRGDLKVIVVNHGDEPFEIKKGDRIAQLVITKSYILDVEEVKEFPDETKRGEKGFGSSGI